MGKKIIPIVLFIALAYYAFSLRSFYMDTGEKAIPAINPNPKQMLRITPAFDRIPAGVDINKYQHNMTARYESLVKDCSVVRAGSGALDWPIYEVEMHGTLNEGFVLWKDLILNDKCKWKFTGIDYKIQARNNSKIVMGFGTNELNSESAIRLCKWNGPFFGNCLGKSARRLEDSKADNTADTTINFNFKEE